MGQLKSKSKKVRQPVIPDSDIFVDGDTTIVRGDEFVFPYEEVYGNEVYTEEGDSIECSWCGGPIIYRDGNYTCASCGKVIDRSEFFNWIGAEPPGPECKSCDNLYPGCIICPHGYVKDEEF